MFAALVSGLAWVSVIAFHEEALYVGGGWMLFGLVTYVVYRKLVEGTSLTERVTVPEVSLKKQAAEIEYSNILVPVFGTDLDDDIIATAGRLADAEVEEGEPNPRMDVIFVAELPLTVPIDAPLPKQVRERADRALARADQVGDEYENVEVGTAFVRARSAGAAIVAEARQRGAEVIVMGARAAEPDPGRRDPGRHRCRAAGRDRGGDGVRAEEGAVPRPADRAARGRPSSRKIPRDVRSDRRLRQGRLLGGAHDAARGPRGLVPRRGPRGARAARGRAGELVGGLRRPVHGRHRARDGRARGRGIERADAFIASTDGDNTNIVIAQIAQHRFNVPNVVARILDPLRAEWYEKQGMQTVCPTRVAIDMLEDELTGAIAMG